MCVGRAFSGFVLSSVTLVSVVVGSFGVEIKRNGIRVFVLSRITNSLVQPLRMTHPQQRHYAEGMSNLYFSLYLNLHSFSKT